MREAFEYYYSLGVHRSLRQVAVAVGKTERTVSEWSRAFNWVERCAQKDLEDADGKDKKSLQLDVKTTYRKLFNNLIAEAVKDMKSGKLRIRNITDLEKVVKMDLALIDNPIDNIVSGEVSLSTEDKKAVDDLLSTIKSGLNSLRE